MATNRIITTTIANGESISEPVNLSQSPNYAEPLTVTSLVFTTIAGTSIVPQVSLDNNTFVALYEGGEQVKHAIGENRAVSVDPVTYAGYKYVRFQTETGGTPTTQDTDETFSVIARDVA